MLERNVDSRTTRLERVGAAAHRVGRFAESAQRLRVLIEDDDIGGERVAGQPVGLPGCPIVAPACRKGAGFEDVNLKAVRVAAERDPGRKIQALREDRDFEAFGKADVLAVVGVERYFFAWTERVSNGHRARSTRQSHRYRE